jgi:hypothetical protein
MDVTFGDPNPSTVQRSCRSWRDAGQSNHRWAMFLEMIAAVSMRTAETELDHDSR